LTVTDTPVLELLVETGVVLSFSEHPENRPALNKKIIIVLFNMFFIVIQFMVCAAKIKYYLDYFQTKMNEFFQIFFLVKSEEEIYNSFSTSTVESLSLIETVNPLF
jgi:hypothetical protein